MSLAALAKDEAARAIAAYIDRNNLTPDGIRTAATAGRSIVAEAMRDFPAFIWRSLAQADRDEILAWGGKDVQAILNALGRMKPAHALALAENPPYLAAEIKAAKERLRGL